MTFASQIAAESGYFRLPDTEAAARAWLYALKTAAGYAGDNDALLAASKCWCLDDEATRGARLYLLAVIASLQGSAVSDLAAAAAPYVYDAEVQAAVELITIADIANVLDPGLNALISSSKCLCLPKDAWQAAELFLLCEWSNLGTCTPEAIAEASACWRCVDESQARQIAVYLLLVIDGVI